MVLLRQQRKFIIRLLNLRNKMFTSKRADQISNREMEPGETLFQFLKRKKQFALRQSLQSSLQKSQQRQPEKQQVPPPSRNEPKHQQPPIQPQHSARATATKRRTRKSSNHKKKVDNSFDSKNSKKENNPSVLNVAKEIFKDEKQTKRSHLHKEDFKIVQQKVFEQPPRNRTPPRSFISMISPLKNRQHLSSLSVSKTVDRIASQQQKKSTITMMTEFSTKKMLKQAMAKVQRHYNKQAEFESEIKERLREFFSKLNGFLVLVEDEDVENDGMQRRLKEVKSLMKLLNGFISSHCSTQKEDISHMIDGLYTQINQILDTFEGQVQKQSRSACQESIQNIKEEYELKIEELNKEKTRLNREMSLASKESAKLEREYNRLLEKFNQLEEDGASRIQEKSAEEEEIAQCFEQQIQALTAQNHQLAQKLTSLQKRLRQSEYKHEKYVNKTNFQHDQQLNSRQTYLLKEISLLKEQCANDINNINKYYLLKIEQYPPKIKLLEDIIQEQTLKLQLFPQKLKNAEIALENEKVKSIEAKNKVDSALIDMFRVNQELFKHWLALKDVKTLLSRLGMFDRFERIYRDIPFDELLFLL